MSCRALEPRRGIVLLVTLFFIMAVTLIVGISLERVERGKTILSKHRFLVQSAVTLDDTLQLLETLSQRYSVSDAASFRRFLQNASALSFSDGGLEGNIRIESARGRLNINALAGSGDALAEVIKRHLSGRYAVRNADYLVDLLRDAAGATVEGNYRTDLFARVPWMYRERIVDERHLYRVLEVYVRSIHDPNVYRVPWKRLFRFAESSDASVDVNYVDPELWEMLLSGSGTTPGSDETYGNLEELPLSEEHLGVLKSLVQPVTFSPAVHVSVTLKETEGLTSDVTFEYNLKTKQSRGFDYAF